VPFRTVIVSLGHLGSAGTPFLAAPVGASLDIYILSLPMITLPFPFGFTPYRLLWVNSVFLS